MVKPDVNNSNLMYYYANDECYCTLNQDIRDAADTWNLTKAGWYPCSLGLGIIYEDDLTECSREFVSDVIRERNLFN